MTKYLKGFRSSSSTLKAVRRQERYHSQLVLAQLLLIPITIIMVYRLSNLFYS